MNDLFMMIRMLQHYGSRFGREVLMYWGIAAGAGYAVAAGVMPPSVCLALHRIEVVAVVWITVRILLAEEGLGITGGWRARPVPRWAPGVARVILLAVVMLVPWFCKAGFLWYFLTPDPTGWRCVARQIWLPQTLTWLAFAAAVTLVALWLRKREGAAGPLLQIGFALVLMVGTIMVCGRKQTENQNYAEYNLYGGPRLLVQGIRQALPTAKDFLGFAEGGCLPDRTAPRAKLLLRVPLNGPQALGNVRLVNASTSLRGVRMEVAVHLIGIDGKLWENLKFAAVLVRYADGTYAACRQNHRARETGPMAKPVVVNFRFKGSFVSPLCLPEFDKRVTGLPEAQELLFFGGDDDAPPLKVPPEFGYQRPYSNSNAKDIPLPQTQTPENPDPLAAEVYQLIDLLNLTWDFRRVSLVPDDLEKRIENLPAEAVPWVLRRFPWSDEAWRMLVHPVLLKHAERDDLPMVLEKLEFDPRLGVLCVEKGWTSEALPLLKRYVRDRLPMDVACVKVVAEAKDPDLADDLAVVALGIGEKIGAVESALREFPGFDWAAFVKRGWWQVKYRGFKPSCGYAEFRMWAAREGDHSALLSLVTGPAVAKEDRVSALRAMVAGEQEDLIAYLKQNIDRITFDSATRKWVLK